MSELTWFLHDTDTVYNNTSWTHLRETSVLSAQFVPGEA